MPTEIIDNIDIVLEICSGERGPQDMERDPFETIYDLLLPVIEELRKKQ